MVSLAGSDSEQLGTKGVVKALILALSSLPAEDPNVSVPCGCCCGAALGQGWLVGARGK